MISLFETFGTFSLTNVKKKIMQIYTKNILSISMFYQEFDFELRRKQMLPIEKKEHLNDPTFQNNYCLEHIFSMS